MFGKVKLFKVLGFLLCCSVNGCYCYDGMTVGTSAFITNLTTLRHQETELDDNENPAVTRFRDYLRIPTVHPNPAAGYERAIDWLRNQADEIGLDFNVADLGEENAFAVWMTWKGSDPRLKSVLFNSHMDVVAVQAENWIHPPFEAYKDSNGNIFARGATDMKCATVGTLEALRKLKQNGFQPLRTIHVSVIPGEELGGRGGMKLFVKSKFFKRLNVAIDIDEGGTSAAEDRVNVYFAEKLSWQFTITARGTAEHGSAFPQFSSGQRLQAAIDKLFEFRDEQFKKLESGEVALPDLTTVNLVKLSGGFSNNVIPSLLNATFDMRIRVTPTFNFTTASQLLEDVVQAAKLGSSDPNVVTIDFTLKAMETEQTVANDSNVWWTVIQQACTELNVKCPAAVITAITDARFVRTLGIPAFGFGPFLNTPFTGHMDNEVINEAEFLHAIDRYATLIQRLSMVPCSLLRDMTSCSFLRLIT